MEWFMELEGWEKAMIIFVTGVVVIGMTAMGMSIHSNHKDKLLEIECNDIGGQYYIHKRTRVPKCVIENNDV